MQTSGTVAADASKGSASRRPDRFWHAARVTESADAAWLGLECHGVGRWSFELTNDLTRHDGKLFGGTGIAVMIAAMEAETERDSLWTTVQYAGSADLGGAASTAPSKCSRPVAVRRRCG